MSNQSRKAEIDRKTRETDISVSLNLDGTGLSEISTGVPFFDHMMDLFARHGRIDLVLKAKGDIEVDAHHTVEDVGICLGKCFSECLGEGGGIARFGSAEVPMQESLAEVAVDLCGRSCLVYNVVNPVPKVGEFDTELGREFFHALTSNGKFTLHVNLRYGDNQHHILEWRWLSIEPLELWPTSKIFPRQKVSCDRGGGP
jgi:imidazoleglycerol-phosphate dehydratase